MQLDFPNYIKFVSLQVSNREDIYKTINDDGSVMYALEAKLIEVLSQALNFRYKVENPADKEFGRNLGNGSWSGIFGYLQKGKSDLAVNLISITAERQKIIDFSYPYYVDDETFVTNKPEAMPKALVIVEPFSYMVWIMLFISFFVVYILVCIHKRKTSKVYIFLIVFGSILEKSFPLKIEVFGIKALVFIWVVGAMFLSYGYKATLLSFLAFLPMNGVRNIVELSEAVKKGSHVCATYKNSYLIESMLESDSDTFRTIGKSLEENSLSFMEPHEVIESSNKKVAFLALRNFLSVYQRRYYLTKDSFYSSLLSVAIRRGFCCKRALDRAIRKIWEGGLYEKILRERRLLRIITDNSTETVAEDKLSLEDTVGAFAVYIVGHVLATITFMLEIIYGKILKDWKEKRSTQSV